MVSVRRNAWPVTPQRRRGRGGMASFPRGTVVGRMTNRVPYSSPGVPGADASLTGACRTMTARCVQKMVMLLSLCFPPHFPGAERFHNGFNAVALCRGFALQCLNRLISHSWWTRAGKELYWMNAFQPNKTWAKKHIIMSGTCLIWKNRQDGTWLALDWESSWKYWGQGASPPSYPAGSPSSLSCRLALLSSYPSLNNIRTRGKMYNIALLQLPDLQMQVRWRWPSII